MTRSRSAQVLRYVGSSLLLMGVFEACSGSDAATPNPFTGPPTLSITDISLGNGSLGEGGDSSVLGCDDTIGITFAVTNWKLYPPGKCGSTPQCGQIQVSLVDHAGAVLVEQGSASVGVNIEVGALVAAAVKPLSAGSYTIQAKLVDDAGAVFPILDGGNSSIERAFDLTLQAGCASGAAGASGEGGMGGAPFIGAGGEGGSEELAGAGGVATP